MIQIDIDMPKKCLDCSIEHVSIADTLSDYYCILVGCETDNVRLTKRLSECPLTEVPDTYAVPYVFAKAHECCGGCVE